MILKRMASLQFFRISKQFDTIAKYNCILPQYRQFMNTSRTSIPLSNLSRCVNPITNNNINCTLLKLPITPIINEKQIRFTTSGGDHVRMWIMERLVAATLPVLIPIAFVLENSVVDGLMAVLVVMHSHWGLEAITVDYIRPNVVGPVLSKIAFIALNIISAVTLAGLLVLIYNGPGISKAIKNLWKVGSETENKEE